MLDAFCESYFHGGPAAALCAPVSAPQAAPDDHSWFRKWRWLFAYAAPSPSDEQVDECQARASELAEFLARYFPHDAAMLMPGVVVALPWMPYLALALRQFPAFQVEFRGIGRFATQDLENINQPVKGAMQHQARKGGRGSNDTAAIALRQLQFCSSEGHQQEMAQLAARHHQRGRKGKENVPKCSEWR